MHPDDGVFGRLDYPMGINKGRCGDMKDDKKYYGDILPKVQAYANSTAYHEYVLMSNPAKQGSNWRWEGFEDWVVDCATTSIWSSFSEREWKMWKDEILRDVAVSARYAASEILLLSDIINWQGKSNSEP
jgi:hypothetical protein